MSNFQVNPNFSEVNLNYSADERQAKMAAMMARMREPEYRTDVDVADAVIERVAVADADNKCALSTLAKSYADGDYPSVKSAKKDVADTEQELADAKAEHSRLRGDSLIDAQAPTTTPVVTAAVELDAGAPVLVAGAQKPAEPNWKMQIQAEATAHVLRLRKLGCNPTRHSILDDLATWCIKNNVRTDTGIHPRASYLRTHVLGGKHWDVPN